MGSIVQESITSGQAAIRGCGSSARWTKVQLEMEFVDGNPAELLPGQAYRLVVLGTRGPSGILTRAGFEITITASGNPDIAIDGPLASMPLDAVGEAQPEFTLTVAANASTEPVVLSLRGRQLDAPRGPALSDYCR